MKRLFRYIPPLVLALLVQSIRATAQDFYPLDLGNTWNYRIFYTDGRDSTTMQLSVIADTLMPNGHTYRRLSGFDVLGAQFVRFDSTHAYYYSPYDGTDVPVYNLVAAPGAVDTIQFGPLVTSQVISVTTVQVFGLQRTMRQYDFDGLLRYQVSLTDGFGITEAADWGDGSPWPTSWSIRGCIIRDTLYGTVVNVPEEVQPMGFELYQNHPNPFNPSTTIEFDVATSAQVRLVLTNLLGQEVKSLVDGTVSAGRHQVSINASGLSSGVYFAVMVTSDGFLRRKMLFLK